MAVNWGAFEEWAKTHVSKAVGHQDISDWHDDRELQVVPYWGTNQKQYPTYSLASLAFCEPWSINYNRPREHVFLFCKNLADQRLSNKLSNTIQFYSKYRVSVGQKPIRDEVASDLDSFCTEKNLIAPETPERYATIMQELKDKYQAVDDAKERDSFDFDQFITTGKTSTSANADPGILIHFQGNEGGVDKSTPKASSPKASGADQAGATGGVAGATDFAPADSQQEQIAALQKKIQELTVAATNNGSKKKKSKKSKKSKRKLKRRRSEETFSSSSSSSSDSSSEE